MNVIYQSYNWLSCSVPNKTLSSFTLIDVHVHLCSKDLGGHVGSKKGGGPWDDLLMICRTFVQMLAQHKDGLQPELWRRVSDKKGKFTRANKSKVGSRCTVLLSVKSGTLYTSTSFQKVLNWITEPWIWQIFWCIHLLCLVFNLFSLLGKL